MTSKVTKCCACNKEVDPKKMFRMYEFVCCSNSCIEPLRKQRQAEEKAKKDALKAKRSYQGAFQLQGGGAY